MSPDEAREFVGELAFVGSSVLAYSLNDLAEGNALAGDEYDETETELVQLVAEGKALVELLQAFRLAARDNRARAIRDKARLRDAIATHGLYAVGEAAEDDPVLFGSFMDVEHELAAPGYTPAPVVFAFTPPLMIRGPRQRASRSRRVRARSRSGSGDDDGPADLHRRCPRCGGAARALLPSALWRCDACAERVWEEMVEHEAARVLSEAERITGEAS